MTDCATDIFLACMKPFFFLHSSQLFIAYVIDIYVTFNDFLWHALYFEHIYDFVWHAILYDVPMAHLDIFFLALL